MRKLPVLGAVSTTQTRSAPLTSAPLSVDDAAQLSMRLKALADPARLRLASLLLAGESGELCTCDLTSPSACRSNGQSPLQEADRGRTGH